MNGINIMKNQLQQEILFSKKSDWSHTPWANDSWQNSHKKRD